MANEDSAPGSGIGEDGALRAVVEGTASDTGQAFFDSLVENLARAIGTYGAWITRYVQERQTLDTVAFWLGDRHLPDYRFTIPGSPCEEIVNDRRRIHIPDRLLELYPEEEDAKAVGAVSYLGVPLLEPNGRLLGHLAVMDLKPLPGDDRILSLFQIFANRAVAEMRRLRLENELREGEEKLARLVDGAMDAIVELDEPEGPASFWIPGGLQGHRVDGSTFPAEATISRFQVHGHPFYVVVLRNVDDRLVAERTINALTAQARYLKEELAGEANPTGIIGKSPGIRQALREGEQVAPTSASVLIYGETGTGKELFARAIHEGSRRKEGPLIKLNCAAIPGTANSSATSAGPSRARPRGAKAGSPWPTAARSFSTRSESFLSISRESS